MQLFFFYYEVMGNFKGNNSDMKLFLFLWRVGATLKGKNLLPGEQILSFKGNLYLWKDSNTKFLPLKVVSL